MEVTCFADSYPVCASLPCVFGPFVKMWPWPNVGPTVVVWARKILN